MNAATEVTQLAEAVEIPMLPMSATSTSALVLDSNSMERMMAMADVMASGRATIPAHLQKNSADCLAVIMQAMQWRMNPFAVAQKTHLVSGTLGYEAQLVNAVINSMAPTKDRLHFEWTGNWEKIVGKFREIESKTKKDDNGHPKKYRVPAWDLKDEEGLKVRVWATMKGEEEPRELTLLMTQARTRNSTLWADDPKQQLAYLATKRWSRLYCPDVIMGVYTPDELDEERPPEKDITPRGPGQYGAQQQPSGTVIDQAERDKLIERLEDAARAGGASALADNWKRLSKEERQMVGAEKLARIKELAVEPVVVEQDPPATVAAEATPAAAPSAGPTYAELMAQINAATDGDELARIQSDCTHLPADQQAELIAAIDKKAAGNG